MEPLLVLDFLYSLYVVIDCLHPALTTMNVGINYHPHGTFLCPLSSVFAPLQCCSPDRVAIVRLFTQPSLEVVDWIREDFIPVAPLANRYAETMFLDPDSNRLIVGITLIGNQTLDYRQFFLVVYEKNTMKVCSDSFVDYRVISMY
jgi:hypothetical protein